VEVLTTIYIGNTKVIDPTDQFIAACVVTVNARTFDRFQPKRLFNREYTEPYQDAVQRSQYQNWFDAAHVD